MEHPTYGYTTVHAELDMTSQVSGQPCPGRHRVRLTLANLKLNPTAHKKVRRQVKGVVPEILWPEERRIQIDATRFALSDGVSWAYVVLDVETRAVLNIHVVRSLSASGAVLALQGEIRELRR